MKKSGGSSIKRKGGDRGSWNRGTVPPSDFDPETDSDYCYLIVCIPNSPEWRRTVKGVISLLGEWRTYERHWLGDNYKPQAVELGRKIYESVCIVCEDKINQLIQTQLLLYSGFTGQQVNLNLTDNPIWAVDADGNPLAANQFGDADGNFTGQSPLKTTFDETWSSYNIADTLYYSFNESFSFFPGPDGAKSMHELVRDFYSPVLTIRDNLDRIHDAIKNQLTYLRDKLSQLLTLQGQDFDFITEGFSITQLMAVSFTNYSDLYPGIWTWLLGGNPKSYFQHTPDGGDEESLAKIIYDKQTGSQSIDQLTGTLTRLFELDQNDPNLRDANLRTVAQLLNGLGTPADASDDPDYTTQLDGILQILTDYFYQIPRELGYLRGSVNTVNDTLEIGLGGIEDKLDELDLNLATKMTALIAELAKIELMGRETSEGLTTALGELEVFAAAASDGSIINYKVCCDSSTDSASTGDGTGTSTAGDDEELPTYTDEDTLQDLIDAECYPIVTDIVLSLSEMLATFVDGLEALEGTTWLNELVKWAFEFAVSFGLNIARILAGLNITILGGPDPTDVVTMAIWLMAEVLARFAIKAAPTVAVSASKALHRSFIDHREQLEDWECNDGSIAGLTSIIQSVFNGWLSYVDESELLESLGEDFVSAIVEAIAGLFALRSSLLKRLGYDKVDEVIDP